MQYDILYGKQYVYEDNGAPITEGHMQMGVKDTSITNLIEQVDGTYSIYGENFTKQTKIYINEEKQTTTFLNNTRVDLKKSGLKDGDIIIAAQVGSSNTIFRTSVKYEFKDGKLTPLEEEADEAEIGRNAFIKDDGAA